MSYFLGLLNDDTAPFIESKVTAKVVEPRRNEPQAETIVRRDKDGNLKDFTTSAETAPITYEQIDKLMREKVGFGIEPGYRPIVEQLTISDSAWHRENQGDDALTGPSHRFKITFKHDPFFITEEQKQDILNVITQYDPPEGVKNPAEVAYVVCLSDFQIGKAMEGRDATLGTQDTAKRVRSMLKDIKEDMARVKPAELLILDVGDSIENCENTPIQRTTNDLDLRFQLTAWGRILSMFISELAPLAGHTTVGAVPSNHGRNRQAQKTPASGVWDDFGLFMLDQVHEKFDFAWPDVGISWATPRMNEEIMSLEVAGTTLAVTHGHQTSGNQMPQWFSRMAGNNSPLQPARVIVTGHYHHFRHQVVCDDRDWFQCPTMDPGSQWFKGNTGEWSSPGMLTFQTANNEVINPQFRRQRVEDNHVENR
ncbi:hypothetical protein [Rothia koreensis]|uniref:hypothetical protein n=1 Tax=Rothia koreensis TaxID=592378 RepID=UPI003FCE54B0